MDRDEALTLLEQAAAGYTAALQSFNEAKLMLETTVSREDHARIGRLYSERASALGVAKANLKTRETILKAIGKPPRTPLTVQDRVARKLEQLTVTEQVKRAKLVQKWRTWQINTLKQAYADIRKLVKDYLEDVAANQRHADGYLLGRHGRYIRWEYEPKCKEYQEIIDFFGEAQWLEEGQMLEDEKGEPLTWLSMREFYSNRTRKGYQWIEKGDGTRIKNPDYDVKYDDKPNQVYDDRGFWVGNKDPVTGIVTYLK